MIKKPSVTDTLVAMNPGQSEIIPFGVLKDMSLRNRACRIRRRYGHQFSVHKDNERAVYVVTRVS